MLGSDESKTLAESHRFASTDYVSMMAWLLRNTAPDANIFARGAKLVSTLGQMRLFNEGSMRTSEIAAQIAAKLQLSQGVQNSLKYLGENWDGKGSVRGVRGQFIPIASRITNLAQTVYIFYAEDGIPAAQEIAAQRRGKSFDPQAVDAFLELSKDGAFWEALGQESLLDTVWAMEPVTSYSHIPASRLDEVAFSFAEFIDMKSPFTANHSRGVALVAEGLAKKIGLPQEEVTLVKRAGLLHDLGKVSVSNKILDKNGKLTQSDWERMRLHPYYTERILSRVEALGPLASIAGAHHEWMNGKGYFRQVPSAQLSKPAHIIAISDMFHALSEERPYRPALETEQVLQIMEKEAGTHLCPDCFASLKAML